MTAPDVSPPAKRRKRFGLSLRVLMVLVLLLGGGMGWLAYQAKVQREAVAAIEAAGGKVYYDLEWKYNDGRRVSSLYNNIIPRDPRWPKWLVDRLGPDYLGHVISVQFRHGPSNQADDELMMRIGRLSGLEDLQFGLDDSNILFEGRCRVTDAGLAHLRGLGRLRRLQLRGTSVKGTGLVHLSGLRNLRDLDLRKVPFTDQDAVALASLTTLETLSIESEELTDAGMVHIAPLKNLKRLDFATIHVTAAGLDRLKGWGRLERLLLRVRGVEVYRFLSQFPELTRLNLAIRDDHSERGDLGLASLRTLPKLQDLSMYFPSYPKSLLDHIGKLKGLRKLNLLGLPDVPTGDYSHLSELTRLEWLWLHGETVDDSVLAHLSGLKELKFLSLGYSKITDAGLAHLSGLTELESLRLDNTAISDEGLVHLVPLKKCKALSIANTRITIDGFSDFRAKHVVP
jgi:internalin A